MNIILGKTTTPMAGEGMRPCMVGEGTKVDGGELTQEKLDTIDWAPFYEKVAAMTGLSVHLDKSIDIKKSISQTRRGTKFIHIESGNLIKHVGIFKGVFSEVYINDFDGAYFKEHNSFTIGVDISWKNTNGGTNGARLFTCWYDFTTKKWDFRENS